MILLIVGGMMMGAPVKKWVDYLLQRPGSSRGLAYV